MVTHFDAKNLSKDKCRSKNRMIDFKNWTVFYNKALKYLLIIKLTYCLSSGSASFSRECIWLEQKHFLFSNLDSKLIVLLMYCFILPFFFALNSFKSICFSNESVELFCWSLRRSDSGFCGDCIDYIPSLLIVVESGMIFMYLLVWIYC